MKKFLLTAVCVTTGALSYAQMTPLGLWQSIDDATHKPKRLTPNPALSLIALIAPMTAKTSQKSAWKLSVEVKKPMAKTCGKRARFWILKMEKITACVSLPLKAERSLKCGPLLVPHC